VLDPAKHEDCEDQRKIPLVRLLMMTPSNRTEALLDREEEKTWKMLRTTLKELPG
jgi:hypothetical protein